MERSPLSNQIKGIIDHAQAAVKDLLAEINEDIDRLIDNLEETYQDNLNLSLDKLDAFSRNKIREVLDAFETINEGIQEDIHLITRNVQETLRQATTELEETIKKSVFIIGESTVYVLDRATYNLLLIIALIALAIGLVAFPWVILKTGLPQGLGRILILALMGIWLLLFGGIAIVPRFRSSIMRFTGIGLKARIEASSEVARPVVISYRPEILELGVTPELTVWAIHPSTVK